jgi:hypothetical protein
VNAYVVRYLLVMVGKDINDVNANNFQPKTTQVWPCYNHCIKVYKCNMYSFLTWITCQWLNKNQPHHKNLKCNSKFNSKYAPSFSRRSYNNLSLSCMLLKVIKHTWLSLLFMLLFKIWYVIFRFGMSSFSCLFVDTLLDLEYL